MQAYDPYPHISVDGSSWFADVRSPGFGRVQGTPPPIPSGAGRWLTDHFGLIGEGLALAAAHESAVLELLETIKGTQSGRDLLGQIENRCKRFDKSLTIVPWSLDDRRKDAVNSSPRPVNPPAASPKGKPMLRGGADIEITPEDERFIVIGTGKGGGSSVRLHFSADLPYSDDGSIGSEPDEVLFHEMVHALRMLQGELQAVPTGTQDDQYHNVEEFFAVLVTNIYMSEKDPHAQLRPGVSGFKNALPDREATSSGFLLNNLENLFWIQHLYPHETRYFHALKHNVKPNFNPIREYVNHQGLYDVFLASLRGSAVPTTRYTVREGDTLKSIAKSYYQDETKWTVIVAANSRLRRANQQELPAGLVLEIPVLP